MLKLATKWHFDAVRELALNQLANVIMGPVDRVMLAKRCNIWKWLRSGYTDLATRSEMISLEEAERIGYPVAHALYRAREEAFRSYGIVQVHDIERIFAHEKRAMEMMEAAYCGTVLEPIEEVNSHSPAPLFFPSSKASTPPPSRHSSSPDFKKPRKSKPPPVAEIKKKKKGKK